MATRRPGRRPALGVAVAAAGLVLSALAGAPAAHGAGRTSATGVTAGTDAPGTVQLFAGTGTSMRLPDGGPATGAGHVSVLGLAHDRAGNVFLSDGDSGAIRRVDAVTGTITTALDLRARLHQSATSEQSATPTALGIDAAGDLFFLESKTYALMELTAVGDLRVLIGAGSAGTGSSWTVWGLAVEPEGAVVVSVGRAVGPAVYRLSPGGEPHLLAGAQSDGYAGDGGPATEALLRGPTALTVAPDGSVYVVDSANVGLSDCVRRIGTDGIITTVVGGVPQGPYSWIEEHDGELATDAALAYIKDITTDRQGRLLLAVTARQQVLRLQDDGTLGVVAGDRTSKKAVIGVPAKVDSIGVDEALDVLPDGRLLVAQRSPDPVVAVLPGTTGPAVTGYAGDGTPAVVGRSFSDYFRMAYPTSIAIGPGGTAYYTDYLNSQVNAVTLDHGYFNVAGTGVPGFSGDGSRISQLDRARSVVADATGVVFIADTVNNRVRRIDPKTKAISTIAGTGTWGAAGDGGPATAAQLAGPHGLALSPDGTLWIADTGNHRIRRIDPTTHTITTLAGTGTAGDAGDGGPAHAAQLTNPRALAVDGTTLYVSDPGTHSVRRIDLTNGTIRTLTGPATGRPLSNPASLLPTPLGLLVAEAGANRILRLDPTTGATTTLAGTGNPEPRTPADIASGTPGLASHVALSQPQGLARGFGGSIIIADTGHHRLLRLVP